MAITRTQIAKQLLAQGGRTGFQGGGADLGAGASGMGSGNVGGGTTGGNTGDAREDRRSEQYGQSRTTAQKGTLSDPVEKQDFFTQSYTGPEVLGGLIGGYRDTVVPNTTAYGNRSRLGSLIMSGIGALAGVPGLGFLTNVGPFDNKAFFDTKVVPSLLDKGKIPPSFKEYMDKRRDGKIDAYGNPINQDNDNNNIILPVDTTFTQAPSTTEQEPEVEEPFQLARRFRAEGGRIEAQEGGIMPRLNQLGSGVSSAEQTLQDINQRLESAESSLGEGGVEQLQAVQPGSNNLFAGRPVTELQGQPMKIDPPIFMKPGNIPGTDAPYSSLRQFTPPQIPVAMQTPLSGIPAAGYADGGNVIGGEFDFESARQMYGLGKLVKKVTRTVKKIAKSDIGKAALIGAIGFGIPGTSIGGLFGRASFGGAATGLFGKQGIAATLAGLKGTAATKAIGVDKFGNTIYSRAAPSLFSSIPGGGVTAAIAGTSLLAGLLTPEQEEEAQELSRGEGIDIDAARNAILAARQDDFRARRFRAEGGSMKEPVAKKTMPLLDLDGKEMDLRAEGGFVPIGRMEKADDVPARLSKNEFVFTADAVRNAGDGDVDKGAEVMYNMMKNLESGGDVSEESQGLEGARKMFQTSQRLEEVL